MTTVDQNSSENFGTSIAIDELEKFGTDIGKNLGNLLDKWKSEDQKSKKNILRRISTKMSKLGRKKTITDEDLEEMRERVEKVVLDNSWLFLVLDSISTTNTGSKFADAENFRKW